MLLQARQASYEALGLPLPPSDGTGAASSSESAEEYTTEADYAPTCDASSERMHNFTHNFTPGSTPSSTPPPELPLLRAPPDKRTLLDNFDILMLTVDELIDGGMILESDAAAIVNRVGMKSAESGAPGGEGASAFSGDQTFNTMFASAREQIARSLLK